MLLRYKTTEGGTLQKTAEVYVRKEHGIDRNVIDPDALKIIARLRKHDFATYIVGGAVRDLLLGKRPKDFDIATQAEPNQIKRLFRNSRIIGKRFRLVHIFFGQDKIIEVSTFRSEEAGTFNNLYGSIEEDAWRRDFTINGLYYDPHEEQVVDFVKGYKDLRAARLKPIIPMDRIFVEDPVRMLRALKYACSTGCRIGFLLKHRIRKSRGLMADISPSRISEEVFKILQGGCAVAIFKILRSYGLLEYLMPRIAELLDQGDTDGFTNRFFQSLATLDLAVREHRESRRSIQLSYIVSDYLFSRSRWMDVKRWPFPEVYADIKDLIKPVTPPNIEVERALVYLIRKRKVYQKHGTLPISEPESFDALRQGTDADSTVDSSMDVDMGDYLDQKRNRSRSRNRSPRGGQSPGDNGKAGNRGTPVPGERITQAEKPAAESFKRPAIDGGKRSGASGSGHGRPRRRPAKPKTPPAQP